jgi:hypothetical protein
LRYNADDKDIPRVTNFQETVGNTGFKRTFQIGTSLYVVQDIQGRPTEVMKYQEEEIWSYGNSTVTFKNGVVSRYNNADNNLKVE